MPGTTDGRSHGILVKPSAKYLERQGPFHRRSNTFVAVDLCMNESCVKVQSNLPHLAPFPTWPTVEFRHFIELRHYLGGIETVSGWWSEVPRPDDQLDWGTENDILGPSSPGGYIRGKSPNPLSFSSIT